MNTEKHSINRKLSVGEMAKIHHISRQTLIFYDKIDLFKPAFIDEKNGYRYYSTLQMPLLREICFLRSIGISIEEIHKHCNADSAKSLIQPLEKHYQTVLAELSRLQEQKYQIEKRLQVYKNEESFSKDAFLPELHTFPERHFVTYPIHPDTTTKDELHLSLMQVWEKNQQYEALPSRQWGSIFKEDEALCGHPMDGAMTCTMLKAETPIDDDVLILPEGTYVCLTKLGMPYETDALIQLLSWIREQGYHICGPIYDECLMDASFFENEAEADFSELQIPIRISDSK